MTMFILALLLILVAAPLLITMKNPARIFEYPFFMAFAFAAFIVPQAVVLIRFPGFVEDGSVIAMLIMCCLCIGRVLSGILIGPECGHVEFTSKPLDMSRLFRVGILFTAVAYAMGASYP